MEGSPLSMTVIEKAISQGKGSSGAVGAAGEQKVPHGVLGASGSVTQGPISERGAGPRWRHLRSAALTGTLRNDHGTRPRFTASHPLRRCYVAQRKGLEITSRRIGEELLAESLRWEPTRAPQLGSEAGGSERVSVCHELGRCWARCPEEKPRAPNSPGG